MIDESKLIFIVSQPRSGSTLLQALLANHPNINTISEHWMLLPMMTYFKQGLNRSLFDHALAIDAFRDFLFKVNRYESFNEGIKNLYLSLYQTIQTERNNYVLDKTPRYYEIIDEITEIFPDARIILLLRNPVAVLNSIINTWNRSSFQSLTRHHHRDIFYAPRILLSAKDKHSTSPNFQFIHYEELVNQPNEILNELYEWLELERITNVYNIPEEVLGKYGDPTGIQSESSINTNSSMNWERSMAERNRKGKLLRGYSAHLGAKFLKMYGYEYSSYSKLNLTFKLFRNYSFHYNEFPRRNYPLSYFLGRFLGD